MKYLTGASPLALPAAPAPRAPFRKAPPGPPTKWRAYRRRRSGLNMVEILVALVIVGLITTTAITFLNDAGDRARYTAARQDLARIAEAIQISESRNRPMHVIRLKDDHGNLDKMLTPYLTELPATDPWGFRYTKIGRTVIATDSAAGDPYVIDEGLGRVLSGGPDGVLQTHMGQDPPDLDQDLVVDYRRHPWVGYSARGIVHIVAADGGSIKVAAMSKLQNVRISPNGLYYAGIQGAAALVWGSVDESNGATTVVNLPGTSTPMSVTANVFPVFSPSSGSLYFINTNTLYRYDLATGASVALTDMGASDTQSGSRNLFSTSQGTIYAFDDSGGAARTVAVSADGKVAYNRVGSAGAGIYVVSGSGHDDKMLVPSVGPDDYLPVCWIGDQVLVYQTNPAAKATTAFYRINVDGSQNIKLHVTDIADQVSRFSFTPSPDGAFIALFGADFVSALRTDGSGFVDQTGNGSGSIVKIAVSNKPGNVSPLWAKSSTLFYMTDSKGYVLQVYLPGSGYGPPHLMAAETLSIQGDPTFSQQNWAATLSQSPNPVAWDLSSDETMIALLSGSPAGLYVIPLLGPSGAVTSPTHDGLDANESPVLRWLDR